MVGCVGSKEVKGVRSLLGGGVGSWITRGEGV